MINLSFPKYLLIIALLFFAFSINAIFAQENDKTVIEKQIDSLSQKSKKLIESEDFDNALITTEEAKKIALEYFGRNHKSYASILISIGIVYINLERFEDAEKTYLEAKNIWAEITGKDNSEYALILQNLGFLYYKIGDLESAEELLTESLRIKMQLLGNDHPDVASGLNNLGILHANLGRYELAEQEYLQAIAIQHRIYDSIHVANAKIYINIGSLYLDLDLAKAKEYLFIAKNILEKLPEKNYLTHIRCLLNIANIYDQQNKIAEAEEQYIKIIELYDSIQCETCPEKAILLNNFGYLYLRKGDYESALKLTKQAVSMYENFYGKYNLNYVLFLNNLSSINWALNRNDEALSLLYEADSIQKKLLINSTGFLSDDELTSYISLFESDCNLYFSFAKTHPLLNEQTLSICFDNTLFYKGFLMQLSNTNNIYPSLDSTSQIKFKSLISFRKELAQLYSSPKAPSDAINTLEEKINTIEKQLAYTKKLKNNTVNLTWKDVQKKLKPEEVVVEFFHYQSLTPLKNDSTYYCALILSPNDPIPHFVNLFEERELINIIKEASSQNFRKINSLYTSDKLYSLIWKPLESHISGSKKIYISPTGLLHRINIGAIPIKDNKSLTEEYDIKLIQSSRQLVLLNEDNFLTDNTAYIIGGVHYDKINPEEKKQNIENTIAAENTTSINFSPYRSLSGIDWEYLPESKKEATKIAQSLEEAGYHIQLDTGFMASEYSFKKKGELNIGSPSVFHIATHGFFFPDIEEQELDELAFKNSANPMIRSGLILAGAQNTWDGGETPRGQEDGILTALEISQMDLSNTELVTLSACETGLGEIQGYEGVYGLQRAFKIAGAKNLIMSLWKVNDLTTKEFMITFYREWLENKSTVPNAFKQAQLSIKNKYPDAPFFWAGFILIE